MPCDCMHLNIFKSMLCQQQNHLKKTKQRKFIVAKLKLFFALSYWWNFITNMWWKCFSCMTIKISEPLFGKKKNCDSFRNSPLCHNFSKVALKTLFLTSIQWMIFQYLGISHSMSLSTTTWMKTSSVFGQHVLVSLWWYSSTSNVQIWCTSSKISSVLNQLLTISPKLFLRWN